MRQNQNKIVLCLNRFFALVVGLGLCFSSFVPTILAAPPHVINYQSRLRDTALNPITVSTDIQYTLYSHLTDGAYTDAASASGPVLWKEVHDGVSCPAITPDADGYFSLQLGACVAFPSYIDFNQPLYLGVRIGTDPEAAPRVLFAAHPYALNSETVDTLHATTTATAGQLLALGDDLGFNISTGTFTGGGLIVNGTSTFQNISFSAATGSSLDLDSYLSIGAIRLDAVGTNNITSGAYLVGVYDEFDNSSATTVQAALHDFDLVLSAVSSSALALDFQEVTDNGSTTTNAIQFAGGTSTAGFNVFGPLLVGTSTPNWDFHVYSDSHAIQAGMQAAGIGDDAQFSIITDSAFGYLSFSGDGGSSNYFHLRSDGQQLDFSNGLGSVMNMAANGMVGVGVGAPSLFKLEIAGHTGPDVHGSYDLGSATTSWRNIFASGYVTTSQLFVNGLEVYGGSTTLDTAYDAGGSGLGRNIIADSGPISITGMTSTYGAIEIVSNNNAEVVWVNNLGNGSAFSARNMGSGAGFYSRNQGTGSGARLDNSTDNGIGLLIDNNMLGTGLQLDHTGDGTGALITNSGFGFGQTIDNTADGIGLQIRNTSSTGLGLYIRQNDGRGMVLDNNTANDGLRLNNNSSGKGIYIDNQSSERGFYMYDTGGKTGFQIDKPLNGGNAIEMHVDDGAKDFAIYHSGSGESFWMRNSGTGASILIEDSSSDLLPFMLDADGHLAVNATNTSDFNIVSGGHVGPSLHNIYDLGSATTSWRNLFVQGFVSTTELYVNGQLIPTSTANIYTSDGYLAGDRTIHANGAGLSVSTTNGGFFEADIRDGSDLGFIHVHPDELELNVANPSVYSGLVFNAGGVSFTHNASASTTQFYIGSNMLLTDDMNRRGMEYAADYSANYNDRTLVDKEYVDTAVAAASGTLSEADTLQTVTNRGNATTNTIQFAGGTSTNDFIISGKLGIGTSHPVYTTDINSDDSIQSIWRNSSGEGIAIVNDNIGDEIGISDIRNDAIIAAVSKANQSLFYFGGKVLNVVSSPTDFLVGINTQSPTSMLDIRGGATGDAILTLDSDDGAANGRDAGIVIDSDNVNGSDSAFIKFRNNGVEHAKINGASDGASIQVSGANPFTVRTDGWDRLVVAGDGNIGIATSTPASRLEVNGVGNSQLFRAYNGDDPQGIGMGVDSWGGDLSLNYDGGNHMLVSTYFGNSGDNYDHVFLGDRRLTVRQTSGFIGIDELNPTNRLHVNGGITVASSTPATSTYALYNLGGDLYWNGGRLATGTSSGGGTLDDAYNFGGAAAGRQIFTVSNATPVEIINPGTDQWENSLLLTNSANGGGIALQTMEASGDYGGRIYLTDNTADPQNGTGAYMYMDNTMQAFEFGYQTAGTRNSSFYIDYLQMALSVPGTQSGGALRVMASNWDVPIMTLASPGANSVQFSVGTSTPEGRVTADSGSLFHRTDGTTGSDQLYLKMTDGGTSGWVAVATASSTLSEADTLQTVTNRGNATTNTIQFAGGTSTGDFGVYRTSGAANLTVETTGDDALFTLSGNGGATALRMSSNGGGNWATIETATNGSFNLVADGHSVAWADAVTGYLGVGAGNPNSMLHVTSNAASTTAILTLEGNAGNFAFFDVSANPESSITASRGDIAVDSTNGRMYIKESGNGTNTGWSTVATGTTAAQYWQQNSNVLSPVSASAYQISVTNNSNTTLTGFKAVNTNDANNYAGAVIEMKGSGADYTNNLYFGKYGAGFYIPSWAGNGVLATDKNLVLGSLGSGTLMRFQVGGGYGSPATVATLDADSFDLQSGVNLNVASNAIVSGLTSSTQGLFLNATGTNMYVANQFMLGQFATLPTTGMRSGALVYNTASSTPFYWDGSQWNAFADQAYVNTRLSAAPGSGLSWNSTTGKVDFGGNLTKNTSLDYGNWDFRIEHGNSYQIYNNTNHVTYVSDGSVYTNLIQNKDSIIYSGSAGFAGAKYDLDYSANFTSRSLVDKGYVSSLVAGVTSTMTLQQVTDNGSVTTNVIEFAGGTSTEDFIVEGSLGIGISTPEGQLHVSSSAAVAAVFDRNVDDGTIISIRQDGAEEGSITVSGNTVSYNAFTGSHYAWTDEKIEKGKLVTLTGVNKRLHNDPSSELLYGIAETTLANDERVLGAYLALSEPSKASSVENPHLVMAVGNGDVWVAENGEDIKAGDYLVSSDVVGHAAKDERDEAKSYVIARAAEDVKWSEVTDTVDGRKHKLVSVFFENFTRDNSATALLQGQQEGEQAAADAKVVILENYEFLGNVTIKAHVAFGGDGVGQAKILSGHKEVRVIFDREYAVQPIVTVTPLDFLETMYRVTDVNTKGFIIQLNAQQNNDKLFDWHAFGSAEGTLSISDGTSSTIRVIVIDDFASMYAPAAPATTSTEDVILPEVAPAIEETVPDEVAATPVDTATDATPTEDTVTEPEAAATPSPVEVTTPEIVEPTPDPAPVEPPPAAAVDPLTP